MKKMHQKIIIAIDGHSSCGKSTLAKNVAKALKYGYIDTGAMYRSVTLFTLENGMIRDGEIREGELKNSLANINISFRYNEKTNHNDTYLNGENVEEKIRTMDISSLVSHVSALKIVRDAMVDQQRKMGTEKGIVMDGRDIGSTVFPQAELKIFLTADPNVRAQRRYDEILGNGKKANFEEVKNNLLERDDFDSNRKESPLRKADDALTLDNSEMTREEGAAWVVEKALKLIDKKA